MSHKNNCIIDEIIIRKIIKENFNDILPDTDITIKECKYFIFDGENVCSIMPSGERYSAFISHGDSHENISHKSSIMIPRRRNALANGRRLPINSIMESGTRQGIRIEFESGGSNYCMKIVIEKR